MRLEGLRETKESVYSQLSAPQLNILSFWGNSHCFRPISLLKNEFCSFQIFLCILPLVIWWRIEGYRIFDWKEYVSNHVPHWAYSKTSPNYYSNKISLFCGPQIYLYISQPLWDIWGWLQGLIQYLGLSSQGQWTYGTHERHSFIKSGFDQFELVWINFSNKYNISWWHSLLPEVTFVLIPLQIWKVYGLVSISPSFIKGFASNKVHWNPFVYFILW